MGSGFDAMGGFGGIGSGMAEVQGWNYTDNPFYDTMDWGTRFIDPFAPGDFTPFDWSGFEESVYNKVDWDKVVNDKGQTRTQHVNRHGIPQTTRRNHGVFNNDPYETVNQAWRNHGNVTPVLDEGGYADIYNIYYPNAGYESGILNYGAKYDYVTIVVQKGTSNIVTAFPSNGYYGVK